VTKPERLGVVKGRQRSKKKRTSQNNGENLKKNGEKSHAFKTCMADSKPQKGSKKKLEVGTMRGEIPDTSPSQTGRKLKGKLSPSAIEKST